MVLDIGDYGWGGISGAMGRVAPIFEQLGKFTDGGVLSQSEAGVASGIATPDAGGRDVVHDGGTGGEAGAGADGDVVFDGDLAAKDDAVAEGDGAGETDLAGEDAGAADAAVVGDLAEVVDLGAVADDGVGELTAIDAGAGANFDVAADVDGGDVGDFDEAGLVGFTGGTIAEAIGTDGDVGMDDAAVAEVAAFADNDGGPEVAIAADPGFVKHGHMGLKDGAGGDDDAGAEEAERPDAGIGGDRCSGIDNGGGMNSRRQGGRGGSKKLKDFGEGEVDVGDADEGAAGAGLKVQVAGNESCTGGGGGPEAGVVGVADEAQVMGRGLFEGLDAAHEQIGGALKVTADSLGDLKRRKLGHPENLSLGAAMVLVVHEGEDFVGEVKVRGGVEDFAVLDEQGQLLAFGPAEVNSLLLKED